MAEDLTLVLWALVTADADLPEPRMSEPAVAGLVELGRTVVNHEHLARMALPMSAMLLIMCNQEHYAHMLMTHGVLRLLLNLLRVPGTSPPSLSHPSLLRPFEGQCGVCLVWQPCGPGLVVAGSRLKGEPLGTGDASKTDVTTLSPHECFFRSLLFDTVATALHQLGIRSA